jgi:hypothetical protein
MRDFPKIFPLGDNAVTVDFGNVISLELNRRVISLAEHLNSDPFPGFIEAVPAYSSLAIFYDIVVTAAAFPCSAFFPVSLTWAKSTSVSPYRVVRRLV